MTLTSSIPSKLDAALVRSLWIRTQDPAVSHVDQEEAESALVEMAGAAGLDEDRLWDMLGRAPRDEPDDEFSLRLNLYRLADINGELIVIAYDDWVAGPPPARMMQALHLAIPFPDDLAGIWAEHCRWQRLAHEREAANRHYEMPIHILARIAGLEHFLDTRPAVTIDDRRARMAWLGMVCGSEVMRDVHDDMALAASLSDDFEAMAEELKRLRAAVQNGQAKGMATNTIPSAVSAPPAPGRRTNAEKQRDVLSMLDAHPEMPDREIARQCGVSPQTVNNWRRRKSNGRSGSHSQPEA